MADPTGFDYVEVRCANRHPMGTEYGPFRVVGVNKVKSADPWTSGTEEETVLYSEIPTKQIANKVLDVYLTEYVKKKYFRGPRDC
ncbi:hypothetical protein SEA_BEUFFERT_247 [Streptomyces phage Beuffert]|nr:hypothetical protein SEA_BEUFFERT_247 [Streptomyces phage Beuffert]